MKKDFMENFKEREEQNEYEFGKFIRNNGFKETKIKHGNSESDLVLFFRKISENIFFVFNIPYPKVKNKTFKSDFWLVEASSENEFMKKLKFDENWKELKIGFELNNDYDYYRKMEKEYKIN